MNKENFLDLPSDPLDDKLLLSPNYTAKTDNSLPSCKVITPQEGFCIKTKRETGEKIFINVCRSPLLPNAKAISDDKLLELLSSEDPSTFRVPLSLGEPHVEVDKSGKGCTVYDVVVNSEFYREVKKREALKQFLIAVAMEGLEEKYHISLDRNVIILKGRKSFGNIALQNVRTSSKPWIVEMDNNINNNNNNNNSIRSGDNVSDEKDEELKGTQPKYTIVQHPTTGHPAILTATIHLPKVSHASSISLEMGEDRLLLTSRTRLYHLDVFLPFLLVQAAVKASFDRKARTLVIRMRVQDKR